ncbi:MAG: ParA family protein, partial [Burkholderiaceae bacterium]
MPVVSFATSKGGAGKTTAAIALATQLAQRNVKVTLMDCDPEQWTASWGRAAGESQVLPEKLEVVSAPADENDLLQAIDDAESRSTIVILDLEGSANAGVGYAIARSDLVVIPMRASGMDARAAIKTVRHVMTQRRLLNREIPMAVLF